MYNPYAVMYDATMDLYGWADATLGNLNRKTRAKKAEGIPCRYSFSGGVMAGTPAPELIKQNILFCGRECSPAAGDEAEITLRDGSTVKVRIGEVRPYLFQWQCFCERNETV